MRMWGGHESVASIHRSMNTAGVARTHLEVHGLREEGLQAREARRGDGARQEPDAEGNAVIVYVYVRNRG